MKEDSSNELTSERLEELNREEATLVERAEALEVQRQELGAQLEAADEELKRLESALAAGDATLEEISDHVSESERQSALARSVQNAIVQVETNLAEVREAAAMERNTLEVNRDREAAGPLHESAEGLVEDFVTRVVSLLEPLQERAELARELTRVAPKAEPVHPVTFNELYARIMKRWKGDKNSHPARMVPRDLWPPYTDGSDSLQHILEKDFLPWLIVLINGPSRNLNAGLRNESSRRLLASLHIAPRA